jgi:hypothetical protein
VWGTCSSRGANSSRSSSKWDCQTAANHQV